MSDAPGDQKRAVDPLELGWSQMVFNCHMEAGD